MVLDHELRARLEQAAADNDRSVGAEVRVALRRHLAIDHEQEEATMRFPGRKELAANDRYAHVAHGEQVTPGTNRHGTVDDGCIAWPEGSSRHDEAGRKPTPTTSRRSAGAPTSTKPPASSTWRYVARSCLWSEASRPGASTASSLRTRGSSSCADRSSRSRFSGHAAASTVRWCRWGIPAPKARGSIACAEPARDRVRGISWVEVVPWTPPPVDQPIRPLVPQGQPRCRSASTTATPQHEAERRRRKVNALLEKRGVRPRSSW